MTASKWLDRARQSITSADMLISLPDYDRACSTAYYAMFYAARAALLHVDQPERALGKTHSGMVAAFSQYLVKPGDIAPEWGAAFQLALRQRLLADYEAEGVDEAVARSTVAAAQGLVAAVAALVEAGPPVR